MPDEIHNQINDAIQRLIDNQDALNAPLVCPHCGASKGTRPESEYEAAKALNRIAAALEAKVRDG